MISIKNSSITNLINTPPARFWAEAALCERTPRHGPFSIFLPTSRPISCCEGLARVAR